MTDASYRKPLMAILSVDVQLLRSVLKDNYTPAKFCAIFMSIYTCRQYIVHL